VQAKLGADEQTVEFLLNILLTSYLAMAESGYEWPLITDVEQERQLTRMVGSVRFSEELVDPTAADAARAQYIGNHPEPALLALVLNECNACLLDLARRGMRPPRADLVHSALTLERETSTVRSLTGTPPTLTPENPPIQGRQSLPLGLTIVTWGK